MSKFNIAPQPTNAPKAPASFQSPAPRLRRKTKGRRTSNASPAPNSEALIPIHPLASTFADSPTKNPGTVSQFGMRRERKSVQPATSANATASPGMMAFQATQTCLLPRIFTQLDSPVNDDCKRSLPGHFDRPRNNKGPEHSRTFCHGNLEILKP